MKKGFTLIELLAVIVILAVIALIATPIILNIINDSRKQAAKSSAELYVNGLVKQIAAKNMINEFNPTSCTITNGSVTCDGVSLDYQVNGKKPTSGSISFNNGVVTGYSLYFDDYTVTKNQNGISIAEGGSPTSFTGTIYRVSSEPIAVGEPIVPKTVSAVCEREYYNGDLDYDSCDDHYYYNSMEECNAEIATYEEEEGVTFSCETVTLQLPGITDYQTESPLVRPIAKTAYCEQLYDGSDSCIDGNVGYQLSYCSSNSLECVEGTFYPHYYLKHEVTNDIIQSSYVCMKYVSDGGIEREICIQGGNYSYFGEFDNKPVFAITDISDRNPTGNFAILSSEASYLRAINGGCAFSIRGGDCGDGWTNIINEQGGRVYAHTYPNQCEVEGWSSLSYCTF